MGHETEIYLIMTNQGDGAAPDPAKSVVKSASGLIFDRHDAMEAHRKTVKAYGAHFGVYRATISVGPRIDIEDELDPGNLNEWQRLVLEDYPAQGSLLADIGSAENRARIICAGLAHEDKILVDAVIALNRCSSAEEAAEIIENAADLAWRAAQGPDRAKSKLYEQAKHHLGSIAEEIKSWTSPRP